MSKGKGGRVRLIGGRDRLSEPNPRSGQKQKGKKVGTLLGKAEKRTIMY